MQELAEVHLFHNPRNVRPKIFTSLKVPRPGAKSCACLELTEAESPIGSLHWLSAVNQLLLLFTSFCFDQAEESNSGHN